MNLPFQLNVNEKIGSASSSTSATHFCCAAGGKIVTHDRWMDVSMCGATAALQVGRDRQNCDITRRCRTTAYLQFAPPWKSDRAHVYQTRRRRRRRRRGRNKHPLLPFWTRKTPIVLGVPRLQGAARYRGRDIYIGGNYIVPHMGHIGTTNPTDIGPLRQALA